MTLEERVWRALVRRCAATPNKDEVKRLVVIGPDDVRAAVREAMGFGLIHEPSSTRPVSPLT